MIEYRFFRVSWREGALLVDFIWRRRAASVEVRVSCFQNGVVDVHRSVEEREPDLPNAGPSAVAAWISAHRRALSARCGGICGSTPDRREFSVPPGPLRWSWALDLSLVSRPACAITGRRVAGVEYRLTEQPAMTCHYLGRNLPSQWVRLSGNDFDPAEIAAAVPVLLGYHPDGDTVVMVCLNRHGSALRLGPLAGIPLAGIPLPAPSGEIVAGYLPPLRALIGTSSADAVLLIAYTAAPGAYAELALTLADALQGTATDVLDVLLPSNARKGARHMAAMDTSGRIGIDREDDGRCGAMCARWWLASSGQGTRSMSPLRRNRPRS